MKDSIEWFRDHTVLTAELQKTEQYLMGKYVYNSSGGFSSNTKILYSQQYQDKPCIKKNRTMQLESVRFKIFDKVARLEGRKGSRS